MKATNSLLWIYTTIGLISAMTTGYFLYQKRVEYWRMEARYALAEVIRAEVNKRSGKEIPFFSFGTKTMSLKSNPRDSIKITSEHGTKTYFIPGHKDSLNIESNRDTRALCTILFEDYPLKADSLNMAWRDCLQKANFPGESVIRLSVIDLLEKEKHTYSDTSIRVAQLDSLGTCYIGQRCEFAISGFIRYSWWKVFSVKDRFLLGGILVFFFLLFFLEKQITLLYRRFLQRGVTTLTETDIHILKLGDVVFNADTNTLKSGEAVKELSDQEAKFLCGLLKAKDYKLSVEEIQLLLWPDGTGTKDRMYTAVKRLRSSLSEISDCTIKSGSYSYQLKILHSIDENSCNSLE